MMRGQKEAPRNGVPFLDSHRPAAYPIGGNDAKAGLQDQCFLERWEVRLIVSILSMMREGLKVGAGRREVGIGFCAWELIIRSVLIYFFVYLL